MVKLVLSGLWVCIVTLLSTFAVASWDTMRAPPTQIEQHFGNLESVRTRMISVPVVADGAIHGYVMAQFVFSVDSNAMKQLAIKPDVFLIDEAFKAIYGGVNVDFHNFNKRDLAGLSKQILANVNKRLGLPLVDDVLIQELNYIAKEDVRGGLRN